MMKNTKRTLGVWLMVAGMAGLLLSPAVWAQDADGVYTSPKVLAPGVMTLNDSIKGTQQPITVLGAFNADTTTLNTFGFPTTSTLGNGLAAGLNGTVNPDGSINLKVSGWDDVDFDGLANTSGVDHVMEGNVELWLGFGGPGTEFLFASGSLLPGQVLAFNQGGFVAGTPFRVDIDNALLDIPGPDAIDYVKFTGLAPGAVFTAEITTSNPLIDSLLGLINPANGAVLASDNDSGAATLSRLTGLVVPANGEVLLAVTGANPGGYTDFDGHHAQTGTYTLLLTYTSAIRTLTSAVTLGNGTVTPLGATQYGNGFVAQLQATPANDWRVKRWADGGGNTLLAGPATIYNATMDADKTVNVEFELKERLNTKVIGNSAGGAINPNGANYYNKGDLVTLTATPMLGMTVKQWVGSDNDSLTTLTNTVTMNQDRTVFVEFMPLVPAMYNLTTSVVGGNGALSPASGAFVEGVVNLTATPDAGYQVRQWTGTDDDNLTTNANTVTLNADAAVTVEFEPIPVTDYQLTTGVVGGAQGHGAISPASGLFPDGTVVNLLATPDNGYRVKQWAGTNNDASTANANTVTMDTNKVVNVEFEPIPVVRQLDTAVIGGNGALAPASGPQNDGAVVNLLATPAAGYRVQQWTGTDNDTLTTNTNTVTMDGNQSVTVEFEPVEPNPAIVPVTLTVIVGDNGSLTLNPMGEVADPLTPNVYTYQFDSANPGSAVVVNLNAFPEIGYEVDFWTGDVAQNDQYQGTSNTVVMNGNKIVGVVFGGIATEMNASLTIIPGVQAGVGTFILRATVGAGVITPADLASGEIYVGVGPFGEVLSAGTGTLTTIGTLLLYRGTTSEISLCMINSANGSILVLAQNANLQCLESPADIDVELGAFDGEDTYDGAISLKFLRGCQNRLDVTSALALNGLLMVRGGLAAQNTALDLAVQETTITWGDTFVGTIPEGGFRNIFGSLYMYSKGIADTDSRISLAIIDLANCTFSITARHDTIVPQNTGSAVFGIQFTPEGFNETDTWEF